MYLELNEEQKLIRDTARAFALAELEPVAAMLDQTGDQAVFLNNLKKLAELGFMGLNIREEYGGSQVGMLAFSVAITEIARARASTAVISPVSSSTQSICSCVSILP